MDLDLLLVRHTVKELEKLDKGNFTINDVREAQSTVIGKPDIYKELLSDYCKAAEESFSKPLASQGEYNK